MKTVFYYTSVYFLDISLEVIKLLKDQVNLHVLIEITDASKNANIINIKSLPAGKTMCSPAEILPEEELRYYEDYFKGVQSVNFVLHHHPTGLSLSTLKVVAAVARYIKGIKPDVVHFEGFTLRTVGLIPILWRIKKLVLTIHDAVLHSGEQTWKSQLPRWLFFNLPVKKTYLFYSAYSMQQFRKNTKHSSGNYLLLQMNAFSYFNKIAEGLPVKHEHLLFFGRISKYKGVDVLLDAMKLVNTMFPNQKLVIAGGGATSALLQHEVLKDSRYNSSIINRYIPNRELVGLIRNAALVICPYTDATQSGVLMTSFALSKPVIATRVGAFEEHIQQDINGTLVDANDKDQLAASIIQCLTGNKFLHLENNLKENNKHNPWEINKPVLEKAYEVL